MMYLLSYMKAPQRVDEVLTYGRIVGSQPQKAEKVKGNQAKEMVLLRL